MANESGSPPNPGSRKIFLVGYRACGKTSVGRRLAARLNWRFLDMDTEICRQQGQSIRELVAAQGWDFFRQRERELLQELSRPETAYHGTPLYVSDQGGPQVAVSEKEMRASAPESAQSPQDVVSGARLDSPGLVVATGGGAVLQSDLWAEIKRHSLVVWLSADPAIIARRLATDPATGEQRPALTDRGLLAEIVEVLAQRRELYQEAAHLQIDTAILDPAAVVEQIVDRLQQ